MKRLRFFIDFDGTISKSDVVDLILERFGMRQWTDIERLWLEGKIGSRECLSRQMDLVSAREEDFNALVDEVEIDPSFIDFLARAKSLGVPVTVVSDGFDIVIGSILKRTFSKNSELLADLPVFSNKLLRVSNGFKAQFPEGPLCEHACANCKPRVMRALSKDGEKIIFVGDGLSDRFAAGVAHLTFAKKKLLKFCQDKKIEHREYQDFREIEAWLLSERKDSHVCVS